MAKGKKSFLLYCDVIHTVNALSNDEAGKLFKHILEYVNDLNPQTDDRILQLTFEPIKQSLKRDLEKWVDGSPDRVQKAKNAGLASAAARQLKATNSNSLVENELNPTNSTVSVSVSVSDSVSEIVKEKKKRVARQPCSVPSEYEVKDFANKKGYKAGFMWEKMQGYIENGMKDSQGNPILNWKLKLNQVWFKPENKQQERKFNP